MPIILESGDKIQGIASNAGEVDFSIFGLKNGILGYLASGQLPDSVDDLYTATGTDTIASVILVNSGEESNIIDLFFQRSGEQAVRIIPKGLTLLAGYSLHTDGKTFYVVDTAGQIQQSGTGGGGITVHNLLSGRDASDCHPLTAITGLASHASRHEDGGSDEINLAGLDGEPSALTTHKNLTTGVHGAGDNYLAYAESENHIVLPFTAGWTSGKLLKGAGVGSNPTEIDDYKTWFQDVITPLGGEILRQSGMTASPPFSATISGTPTSTTVVYTNPTNEGSLAGIASGETYWGRIMLYNSTRQSYRKIISVNISTKTIITESSSDNWASGDSITTQSQVCTEAGYIDIDLSNKIDTDVFAIVVQFQLTDLSGTSNGNRSLFIHPCTTYDSGKRLLIHAALANEASVGLGFIPTYNQKICIFPRQITNALILLTCMGVLKS